jgi:hypothetical protein
VTSLAQVGNVLMITADCDVTGTGGRRSDGHGGAVTSLVQVGDVLMITAALLVPLAQVGDDLMTTAAH